MDTSDKAYEDSTKELGQEKTDAMEQVLSVDAFGYCGQVNAPRA